MKVESGNETKLRHRISLSSKNEEPRDRSEIFENTKESSGCNQRNLRPSGQCG